MRHTPIPFNRPYASELGSKYILEAISNAKLSCDGQFTKKAQALLQKQISCTGQVLLTTSCTHALEMAAILLDLKEGDEVIVPSYAFVTSALAFAMHGAKLIFIDIRPDTLNLDETQLESLITPHTRAIVAIHYSGVGCNMPVIMDIAERYDLYVIEDNAHGLYGMYENRPLGNWGHIAVQSFHETKNIVCGEGGAIIINHPPFMKRAEIIREKGTNRARFFRNEVDKYTWVDRGSSYGLSDILAAYLFGQLQEANKIQKARKNKWELYSDGLNEWANNNGASMPYVPPNCKQPYHLFYFLMPDLDRRSHLIKHLKKSSISAVFHYMPLHKSNMAERYQAKQTLCPVSEDISDRILRLPLYPDLSEADQQRVISVIQSFKPITLKL